MVKPHRIHSERISVVRVNVLHIWYRRIALLLFVAILPVGTYYGADWYLGENQRQLEVDNSHLVEQVSLLRFDLREAEQDNANLLMSAQMNQDVEQQLQNELISWRERNELLESEIQFYLSLMEPASNNQGVFVQSAELVALDDPNAYRYSVIVAQKSQEHPRVEGDISIELISENENQSTVLGLAELADEGANLPIGFRFFQQLEGVIYLPEAFRPDRWVVRVDLVSSGSDPIIESYDWPYLSSVE